MANKIIASGTSLKVLDTADSDAVLWEKPLKHLWFRTDALDAAIPYIKIYSLNPLIKDSFKTLLSDSLDASDATYTAASWRTFAEDNNLSATDVNVQIALETLDELVLGDPTSLSTGTVDATTYGITSDGGTDDVVLVEATTTTAGILGSAKWNEIVANTAKVTYVAPTTLTGVALDLSNATGHYYNMASANAGETYTFSGAVVGGWAISLINTTNEPVVTGATKITGALFITATDMYLVVRYNGTATQFYFLEI
jgi:hypothetical protein